MGESHKKMGLFGAVNLMLLSLLGTGLFFGPALSAQFAGPAAILAWLVLGINTVYVGLLFAELASRYPEAGGIYAFAKRAYGRFPSFLIGWIMWLVATINTSVLIIGALTYAFPVMGAAQTLLLATILIVILHVIAYAGMGATETILDILGGAVIVFVLVTIFAGAGHVQPGNYLPFFTHPGTMLFVALFFILETYFGWETASFLAEETHEPHKTIPRAIMISCVIGAALGITLTVVLYGIIPADQLANKAAPLADVFAILFGDVGSTILRGGVFISLIGSAAGNIVAGPRLLESMARDKLFITQLAQRSERTGTPARAILFQGILSTLVVFAALGNYTLALSIMVPLALLMYIPTILSVPVLRMKDPTHPPFKAPFVAIGSILSALLFLGALAGWMFIDPLAFDILGFILSLLLFSLPIYLLLNVYYNPSTQLFFSDALAYPALVLESLIVPKRIRKKMLTLFSNFTGKTVLELGAGVGSFTLHLAEAVTPQGKVYAVEAGKNNVGLLSKRFAKHKHVRVVHDEHITSRLHPEIKEIDAVFSIGMLGYLHEDAGVLQHIAQALPEHAPICFMEYIDYFGFIPNPGWLSDLDAIKKQFNELGLAVRVEKVKGLFWNYVLVYGVKSSKTTTFA